MIAQGPPQEFELIPHTGLSSEAMEGNRLSYAANYNEGIYIRLLSELGGIVHVQFAEGLCTYSVSFLVEGPKKFELDKDPHKYDRIFDQPGIHLLIEGGTKRVFFVGEQDDMQALGRVGMTRRMTLETLNTSAIWNLLEGAYDARVFALRMSNASESF